MFKDAAVAMSQTMAKMCSYRRRAIAAIKHTELISSLMSPTSLLPIIKLLIKIANIY